MPVTLDTTQDMIFTELRTFLLGILPKGVEVIQGQVNRVAEPKGPDWVVMTPVNRKQMATNVNWWDEADPAASAWSARQSTVIHVQLDVHGPNSEDNLQIISTLARDYYGVAAMETMSITPLYTDDAIQAPFINGEGQYENRWTMNIAFDIEPTVVTPQDFAANLSTSAIVGNR